METLIMRGKAVAELLEKEMTEKIENAKKNGKEVCLAVVTVGEDEPSHVYKNRLIKIAERMGAKTKVVELPKETKQEEVEAVIEELNNDLAITGILPMMPMPKHINGDAVGAKVDRNKDVDCLNPLNAGELYMGKSRWAPCTPRACMATLKHYGIELSGKHVVVVGRSNVVGKPVALLLLQENATVTICHSRTENLQELIKTADVVVAAVGRANFVTSDMVKEGVVIVDVGINFENGKLVGDVSADVSEKASAFTPVPGGIGVVSNVMVMDLLARNL